MGNNKAACEVGRKWRECWRETCANDKSCAAPATTKPLSETVIASLAVKHLGRPTAHGFRDFARDVEAAHGIKE